MKIRSTYLDKTFSLYIRTLHNFTCQHCGKTSGLMDCAHIKSRRNLGGRWREVNATCLCRGCHMYFTERPFEWVEWVKTIRTPEQWMMILVYTGTVTKFTAKDRLAMNKNFKAKLAKLK